MSATIENIGEQTTMAEYHPYDAEGPLTITIDLVARGIHAVAGFMHRSSDYPYPNPGIPDDVLNKQPKGPAYATTRAITTGAKVVGREFARSMHGYDTLPTL